MYSKTLLGGAVALTLSAPAAIAAELNADDVGSVARAMELPYGQIYTLTRCNEREIDGTWYVKCAPRDGGVTGGLWVVVPGPAVIPMNGKAKGHADTIGEILDNQAKAIPVKNWFDVFPGKIPDVKSVLDTFETTE